MFAKISRYTLALIALMALLALAAGCAPAKPSALSDDEVAAVTENILTAINDNDYQAFIQDFSDEMLNAFPEDEFTNMRDLLQTNSGNYLSMGEARLSNAQDYAIYRFTCKYDQEDVVVTITFAVDGTKVDGLFFDSKNLRNASQ